MKSIQKLNLANLISFLRILLIPFILFTSITHSQGLNYLASFIFLIASLTDFLDGYLARRLKLESKFGANLDLIADKLLVSISLIYISFAYNSIEILIPSSVIIIREIMVTYLRFYLMYEKKKQLKVKFIGKFKTFSQMISLIILFLGSEIMLFSKIYLIGVICLNFAAIFTIISFLFYYSDLKENL